MRARRGRTKFFDVVAVTAAAGDGRSASDLSVDVAGCRRDALLRATMDVGVVVVGVVARVSLSASTCSAGVQRRGEKSGSASEGGGEGRTRRTAIGWGKRGRGIRSGTRGVGGWRVL